MNVIHSVASFAHLVDSCSHPYVDIVSGHTSHPLIDKTPAPPVGFGAAMFPQYIQYKYISSSSRFQCLAGVTHRSGKGILRKKEKHKGEKTATSRYQKKVTEITGEWDSRLI
jgi:hypothetical protein